MSNIFNSIIPAMLTIPGETEGIKIGVAKEYAHLLWLTPLFGIVMVFAVLAILMGVLMLFKLIFARPKKNEEKTNIAAEASSVAATQTQASAAAADDAELIAILTAAIVAYESEQNPNADVSNFRVVSYRRTNGGRSWNAK